MWLHAVSVGEVLSSVELIRQLRTALPQASVFVSCGTVAGREAAERRLGGLADGIFYAPFDYVWPVRRVLGRLRPALVVVLETEIWPNFWREARRAGCALAVVNGRISDRAAGRYRRFRSFFRAVLTLPDVLLVQTERDRERYIDAGAAADDVRVGGNLKYDFQLGRSVQTPPELRNWFDDRKGPLWIAASTVGPEFIGDVDEDDVVLAAQRQLADVRLVIAPRKPERFEAVARKLTEAGLPYIRRSELAMKGDAPVLLLDSVGELSSLFQFADVVFMGGTLAHRGGHNVLEPALSARAVIVGPHLENFTEIQRAFREGSGFLEISEPGQLACAVEGLLADDQARTALAERARTIAQGQQGGTSLAVAALAAARWQAIPRAVVAGPLRPLLWMLSQVWIGAGGLKRRLTKGRSLPVPVVCVGGLAMGGVGKTPVVRYLARELARAGKQPAVLTRGYKRIASESATVIPAGSIQASTVTGDEAQLILRDGHTHLGIGADRQRAGCAVYKQLRPRIFLMDDGFQHFALRRDLDIVLLDGLDPFGGGEVFPLGRLREPLRALSRAGVIVITRSEGREFDGILRGIRRHNNHAPVLFGRTVPVAWVDLATGSKLPLCEFQDRAVVAFCGLANPEAFRSTLCSLGYVPLRFLTYRDHHRYSEADLDTIVLAAREAGAQVLLTTEKDSVNLHWPAGIELRTAALVIDVEVPGLVDLVLRI